MKIGLGFRIRTAIDNAAENGVDIPQTDDGRHFCLSCYLKGVYNMHCGSRNLHRPLSQSEFGQISEWCDQYCGWDEAPQVQEVDTCRRIQASTLSAQTGRPRGS